MIKGKLEFFEESKENVEECVLTGVFEDNVKSERVSFEMNVEEKKIVVEFEAKDGVAARAFLNTLLRNYSLLESLRKCLKV